MYVLFAEGHISKPGDAHGDLDIIRRYINCRIWMVGPILLTYMYFFV
jgi:hypothetical protein